MLGMNPLLGRLFCLRKRPVAFLTLNAGRRLTQAPSGHCVTDANDPPGFLFSEEGLLVPDRES